MRTGEKLGRYEIREMIGNGGMGEVYRAADTQLDRDVALKVLLPEFCSDSERVKRFKFEAKAVSALNHPGIITIHEIVEENERLFISTELVNGVTVRNRIEKGDLTLFEAVKITEQVADALSVAHKANIVHRDIKPENIMVRGDGYAKVLDFGLAKPIVQSVAGAEDATIQLVKTQPGLVMGSVRYMSPEQARGKEADGTTDVWSLGIVLYEMISGENPFDGETISDSIAALIHKDPEPLVEVPEELKWIIRKCLNKRSEERYQDIKDLALDLKEVRTSLDQHTSVTSGESEAFTATNQRQHTLESKTLVHRTTSTENWTDGRSRRLFGTRENTVGARVGRGAVPLVLVLALTLFAASAWYFAPLWLGNSPEPFRSLQVSKLTDNGRAHSASVSPDGKLVVFVDTQNSNPRLVVQQISSGSVVEIVPPTEKSLLQPVFSPDGNFVYYVSNDNGVGTLFRVPTLGGKSSELLVDIDSRPALTSDGKKIAFIRHDPNEGGDTVYLADGEGKGIKSFSQTKALGFDKFADLIWTVGDSSLLLAGFRTSESPNAKMSIVSVDAGTGKEIESVESTLIDEQGWAYVNGLNLLDDGSGLLFVGRKEADDSRQVWFLDYGRSRIESVTTDTSDYESLSVSDDGNTIIATKSDRISGLVEADRQGHGIKQLKSESKNFLGHLGIAQMPDGQILFSKLDGREADIFALGTDGTTERQLTSDSGINVFPTVGPDGKYIVFSSSRNDSYGIWRMDSDGANPMALTKVENGKDVMPQIGSDGETVVFVRQKNDGSKPKLMRVPISGGKVAELVQGGDSTGMAPQFSPDGRRLAYTGFQYDESSAEFKSFLKIAELKDGRIDAKSEKIIRNMGRMYKWTPEMDSLSYINKEGDDGIMSISLNDEKESGPIDFGGGMVMNFIFSRDGKKIIAVKGMLSSDLVLIRNQNGA